MECSIRSSLCRLCLCCDLMVSSIFEHKASDQYNITVLLKELLQIQVSESDGYPKVICSSCLKTIIDFKKFKEDCLEAVVTYDNVIRLPKTESIQQQIQDVDIEEQELMKSFIKQEFNADRSDAFGNLLIKEERSLSEDEEASPILGVNVDEIKQETGVSQEENCLFEGGEGSPIPAVDSYQIKQETAVSQIVEHPVKIEPPDSEYYEDATDGSTVDRHSEQNPGRILTHSIDIAAEVVTIQNVNPNTLEDSTDVLRIIDLKRNDDESLGSISKKTCSSSSVDEYIANGKATVTPASSICEHEPRVVKKNSMKENREQIECQKINEVVKSESFIEDILTFRCNFCRKAFKQKESLAIHINLNRVGVCSTYIRSNDCLNDIDKLNVNRGKHKRCKIHKCSYCEKCFRSSYKLRRHEKIHTKEKPYHCQFCKKCFNHSSALASHLRIHTKEKPYKCTYCEKCFNHSGNIARHLRIHKKEKPYKCGNCEKCFTTKGDLRKHVIIHTKEKPYKCGNCEKGFTRNSDLKRHSKIHTEEKPYKCINCEQCFTRKDALSSHEKIHKTETV